jgi:hypothetical protein
MAVLYITEFERVGRDAEGHQMPLGVTPVVANQTVAIGSSSAQSAALNGKTRMVRIHTDAICHVAIGSNPTATTSLTRLAADQTEYFGVLPGTKIAVIAGA